MIETAILTINGERFLFQAAEPLAHCPDCDLWLRSDQSCPHIPAYGLGENAERHGKTISTTAADPLSQEAVDARGVGAVPHPSGLGSTRLFSSSHGGLNSPEGQHHHA